MAAADPGTDFTAAITAAYATDGPAIDLGRGVLGGELVPEARWRPAGDDEPPRARRRRDGHRQDEDAAGAWPSSCRPPACRSSSPTSRATSPASRPRRGRRAGGEARRRARRRRSRRRASRSSSCRSAASGPACRCARPSRTSGRSSGARCSAPTRPRSRASASSSATPTTKGLPLLDLADLRALLDLPRVRRRQGRARGHRRLSRQRPSACCCARSSALEDGGGKEFFGEPQFDDRRPACAPRPTAAASSRASSCRPCRTSRSCSRPRSCGCSPSCSRSCPRRGDLEKPKLVFFFDEAHLLFDGATKAFVESVVQTVRLIRSKGVGVFFVTQTPKDVPADVLGQLGNRVQHALRAFTPDDAKALKATVSTFPKSAFYDLEELLTALGIGEAAVTILVRAGVADAGRAHAAARARLADGPGRRRRGCGEGVAAVREVRHARRREQRARDAGRPAPGAAARAVPPADDRRSRTRRAGGVDAGDPRPAGPRRSVTSCKSREGKRLQKRSWRGVFGLLKKRL